MPSSLPVKPNQPQMDALENAVGWNFKRHSVKLDGIGTTFFCHTRGSFHAVPPVVLGDC